MGFISLFLLKLFDNMLSVGKTISLSKDRYFTGALFNACGTFFYLTIITQIANNDSIAAKLVMCVAAFVGTLATSKILKKSERDRLYIFDITADTEENGKTFADNIRRNDIAIKTSKTYDKNLCRTLSCKVYCSTREETSFVKASIPEGFRYNIYVPAQED